MARIGNTDISRDAVRVLLSESSKSIWTICNNPNINIWAKYSPKTDHGTNIPFSCQPVSDPYNCVAWEYNPIPITEARLGDFRNYNHNAIVPISGGFPSELYSNADNMFMVATIPDEGDNINCSIIYNTRNLYFGVAIRLVNDHSKMIWCTNPQKGASSVVVNLRDYSAYFGNGATVESVLFYAESHKTLDAPDIMNNYYSLKADATVIDRKEFTIKSYSPPITWESLRLIVDPNSGNWFYDEVSFNNIGIEIKGKVQTDYRMGIRIVTPDDRYYNEYLMLRDIRVEAGQTVRILDTGMIDLRFYNDYNMVFVQAINLKDENNLIAEIPVMRMIEQSQ